MLHLRIMTAIVLICSVFGIIFYAPPMVVQGVIVLFLAVASLEWSRFYSKNLINNALMVGLSTGAYFLLMHYSAQITSSMISMITALLWLLACMSLWRFNPYKSLFLRPFAFLMMGVLILPLSFYHLHQLVLAPEGVWHLIALIAMVSSSDIGAYFCGKAFGKRALAPLISPNKTQEGVLGGLLLATGMGVVCAQTFYHLPWWAGATMGGSLAVIAVLGDLFESSLKRLYNIKDSGKILPGHGGVLDRLDSLLPASVIYMIILKTLQGMA